MLVVEGFVSSIFSVLTNVLVAQSCPTEPMDYSLPGFSVHEILQARILEWAAMPSPKGSS